MRHSNSPVSAGLYLGGKKRNKDNLALALQVAESESAGDDTLW